MPSLLSTNGYKNHPIFTQTFCTTSQQLPTIAEIKNQIYTDRSWMKTGEFNLEKQQRTIQLRESYVGQSFVLLTHEFIKSLQQICKGFTTIVELCAGIGWLGYWLTRYGADIYASIDNKSWSEFSQERYLPIIQKMDSLQYLQLHPEVDLFILAWPQEDNLATSIWQALRPGQYLLYIGEGIGGCTANREFFNSTHSYEITNRATEHMKKSFLSFEDFHDQPHLYKKSNSQVS